MPEITKERVIQNLIQARKASGMTQKEAAAIAELDRSSLSKIESGTRGLEVEELLDLCLIYDVEVSAVFEYQVEQDGEKAAIQEANNLEQMIHDLNHSPLFWAETKLREAFAEAIRLDLLSTGRIREVTSILERLREDN